MVPGEAHSTGSNLHTTKTTYQLVRGRPVSNGTVGELLQRMLRKQILVEKAPGLYTAGPGSLEIVLSRIDTSRVRIPGRLAEQRSMKATNQAEAGIMIPQPIWNAWNRALQITQTYGSMVALWFIAYTLMGVRATGYPLLWLDEWFVICENKTGFCHYYFSKTLHEIMESLGLQGGVLVADTEEPHGPAAKHRS